MYACKTILCSYNGAEYITEQILSIKNSFKKAGVHEFTIDVYDDGSSDQTYNKVSDLQTKFKKWGLTFNNGRKEGVASNFINAIISMDVDNVDWIFLSDQDDVWCESKVSEYFCEFSTTDIDVPTLVFSDAFLVDKNCQIFDFSFFAYQGLDINVFEDDSILFRNCVQGATIALNKQMVLLLKKSISYIDVANIVMHDWWLAILSKYYGEFRFINRPLIFYRQHDKNQIGAKVKGNKFIYFFSSPMKYFYTLQRIFNQAEAFTRLDNMINDGRRCREKNFLMVEKCGLVKKVLAKMFFNKHKFN
ncbi:glycosyltransferase [Aeromonas veronii]